MYGAGPNALCSALVVTLIFLTSKINQIRNIYFKLAIIFIYCFLSLGVIHTQSRTYGIIILINLFTVIFFDETNRKLLTFSLPFTFFIQYS